MNTAQRNFLVGKIQENTKKQIKVIEEQEVPAPNLHEMLFKSIMSGKLKLRSEKEIMDCLMQRALKAGEDGKYNNNWLGLGANSWEKNVIFQPSEIFILPKEYVDAVNDYKNKRKEIQDLKNKIFAQEENLVLRIQLASDKTLQSLVNEIDDMGDVTFIDDTLKLLTDNVKKTGLIDK